MENPIGKLDEVLEHLSKDVRYFQPEEIHNSFTEIEYPVFTTMVDKLQTDKYLLEKQTTYTGMASIDGTGYTVYSYKISYEGILFIRAGGYQQKQVRENAENTQLDTIEKNQKFHRNALTWLTFLVAVGTLIAAFYYFVEIGKFFCWW